MRMASWVAWVGAESRAKRSMSPARTARGLAKSLEQAATPRLMFWAVDHGTIPYRYENLNPVMYEPER